MSNINRNPEPLKRPWGSRLTFTQTGQYMGRLLSIRKGKDVGLHYHQKRDESIYIYTGKVLVTLNERNGTQQRFALEKGDCLRLAPGTLHNIHALQSTVIFEVSTPEVDDIIRVEPD